MRNENWVRFVIFTLAFALAAAGFAQQGRIAGPVAGYVFDSSARALRPVLGVPGASILGDKVSLGLDAVAVVVSPRLDGAIALGANGLPHFLRIDSGAVSERPAEGLTDTAQAVFYSPGGSAAALFSQRGVQLVTGLPDAPKSAGNIRLGLRATRSTGRSEVVDRSMLRRLSLAVSDDGAYLLFASNDAVRLLTASGEDRHLLEVGAGALVAFAPGSNDAAVADVKGARIVMFKDVAGATVRRTVAEGIESVGGLAFSTDGSKLMAASAADRAVHSFKVDSGERSAIGCNCQPTGLTRMGTVFRLNELGSGPLWLLDAAAAEPRTVFVPAATAN